MKIGYTKTFIKDSKKLAPTTKAKLVERLKIFAENPTHVVLRNHQLKGVYKNYRSIDVTGDVRALYITNDDEVVFDQVGSHSKLYG